VRLLLLIVLLTPASVARADERLELDVRQAVARRARPPLLGDPALDAAARENSAALAELPEQPRDGVTSYLRFVLQRHGVRDATVRARAVRVPRVARRAVEVKSLLGGAATDFTHLGVGVASTVREHVLTIILVRRRVTITSAAWRLGQKTQICGRLLSGRRPRLYVTTPRGQILERAAIVRGRAFCGELPRATRGRHQVEVMIEGRYGPEVAALFPIYVDTVEPSLPEEKVYPPSTHRRTEVERRLLELSNRARQRAHLPTLALCAALSDGAQAHSADMHSSGFFGHRSPARGDLGRRVSLAGLRGQLTQASENLAIASSPSQAHDGLLASPSHRKNLLDPRMTHLGVGVAFDPTQHLLYITQWLARIDESEVCQ
jgi:uncharacterized protein YkwD